MNITLIYFKFPFWRAEVSRLALHLGGIEFENRCIDGAEFRAARSDGRLPFGQVPVLIVDGVTIAQTGAIARFCGKLSGLYPTDDPIAAARIDQLIDAATDITARMNTGSSTDPDAKLAARKVLAETTLPQWFGFLEALAPSDRNGFFVGDSLSVADLAIWRLMGWFQSGILDGIPATIVDDFPRLSAHARRIGSMPAIRDWMDTNYG